MTQQSEAQFASEHIEIDYLLNLMPMAQFEQDRLLELSKHIRMKTLPVGTMLFSRGDEQHVVYYLMEGEIDLQVNTSSVTLSSESPQARQPVDPHNPHQFTAIARTPVNIIEIDCDLLDIFASPGHRDYYNVSKIKRIQSKHNKEMDAVLQSRIFQMIPPVNVKVLLKRFEEMSCRRNQIIFRQKSKGDYYYIIKSGSCAVLRYTNQEEGWHVIADLGPGDGFGEEALLSDKLRNATVMMSTDGTLLRLSREDFDQLIKTPVVKTVQYNNALELIKNGALILDIRSNDDYASDTGFPKAIHIPITELRDSLDKIPRNHPLLVHGDNEQRSAYAAYILLAHGLEALVLQKASSESQ